MEFDYNKDYGQRLKAALKILSRFTITRDGLVKYIREDGTAIYGKDAVKLFKKDMKPCCRM